MGPKSALALALALLGIGGPTAGAGERYDWSLGGYVGIFSGRSPNDLLTHPDHPEIQSNYIAALTGTATLLHFDAVPVTVEIEGVVAKRFGDDHFFEFGALPMLRWRLFPWNETVYTNFRVGPLGVSYTMGDSQWEVRDDGTGQRLQNFMVFEITVADPADTSWEGFVRLHHRSTIFGLIGDSDGNGDDFLSLGIRKRF